MKRPPLVAVIGVCLAVVMIVCTIVVVKVVTNGQREADYRACLESYGFSPGTVTEDELEEAIEVAEICSR